MYRTHTAVWLCVCYSSRSGIISVSYLYSYSNFSINLAFFPSNIFQEARSRLTKISIILTGDVYTTRCTAKYFPIVQSTRFCCMSPNLKSMFKKSKIRTKICCEGRKIISVGILRTNSDHFDRNFFEWTIELPKMKCTRSVQKWNNLPRKMNWMFTFHLRKWNWSFGMIPITMIRIGF